jgi:hypothetical protein
MILPGILRNKMEKSTVQNSGVTAVAMSGDEDVSMSYYG